MKCEQCGGCCHHGFFWTLNVVEGLLTHQDQASHVFEHLKNKGLSFGLNPIDLYEVISPYQLNGPEGEKTCLFLKGTQCIIHPTYFDDSDFRGPKCALSPDDLHQITYK